MSDGFDFDKTLKALRSGKAITGYASWSIEDKIEIPEPLIAAVGRKQEQSFISLEI